MLAQRRGTQDRMAPARDIALSESQSAQPALLPDRRCAITSEPTGRRVFKPTFAIAVGEGVKRDVTGGVNLAVGFSGGPPLVRRS